MRLKQFLYLQTVAECKSMAKASEKLYISHQALSYALRKLEIEYNVHLLNRTPYGVSLTKEGEEFLSISQQILALHEQLEEKFIKKDIDSLKGDLTIVASNRNVNDFLPNILYWLNEQYNNLNVIAEKRDRYVIVKDVSEKKADIGIIALTLIDGVNQISLPENVIFIPLFQHKFKLILNKKNPLSEKRSSSLKKMINQKFVLIEDELGNNKEEHIIYGILKKYKIEDIFITSRALNNIMLKEGKAVTLLEESDAQEMEQANSELASISLRENICAASGILIHKDNLNDWRIKLFLDTIKQFVGKNINEIKSYNQVRKT